MRQQPRGLVWACRQQAPVGAGDRQPEHGAAPRARVVERQADGQRRLRRQPGRRVVARADRRGQARVSQERPKPVCRLGDAADRCDAMARPLGGGLALGHGLGHGRSRGRSVPEGGEVEGQLQAAPLPAHGAAAWTGREGPPGHDGGRDGRRAVLLSEQLAGGQRRLALDGRQALDERPELVLAEERG